ncbi:hypothetical protein Pint_06222 [Pistacia integerrima]|uniref:Uncharacterized protein n=2 Tax=Pistacia TaxID=55512 RepID=A0ACC0Z1B7_9ROSI|nr:hypothetical protein Pint_06222 [Pistacia integerrima]
MLSDYELHNRKSYVCSNCNSFVADVPNLLCPRCKQKMSSAVSYVPPSPANTGFPVDRGFIKGSVSFIVMDNLEFMPMSTKNLLPLLRKFNLKESHELEEMDLKLDSRQVMRLLKLSLESKTVFTSYYQLLLSEALKNACNPM